MKRTISIFLLNIILMVLLPWQLMCIAHPMGHTHHHAPGELSLCEQRKLCTETSFWPPMDCYRPSIDADDYQLPKNDKLTLSVQTLAVAAVLLELIKVALPENVVFRLPDPKCRSGPPLPSNLLRGPPLA